MPEAQPALFTHFGDYGVWKMHISGNSAQFPVLGGGGAIDL